MKIRTVIVGGMVLFDGRCIVVECRGIAKDGQVIVREGPEFRFDKMVDALIDALIEQLRTNGVGFVRSGLYRARWKDAMSRPS